MHYYIKLDRVFGALMVVQEIINTEPLPMPAILKTPHYQELGLAIKNSFEYNLGKSFPRVGKEMPLIEAMFRAPFVLLCHGAEADPIFCFGNMMALQLFDYRWDAFIQLPSRYSAQAPERLAREQFLSKVLEQGYVDDYSGLRVSAGGRRFMIHNACVWNVSNDQGEPLGQAAMFDHWQWLADD